MHFQENYYSGYLELSPLRELGETAHTVESHPPQRARKPWCLPSSLPPPSLTEDCLLGPLAALHCQLPLWVAQPAPRASVAADGSQKAACSMWSWGLRTRRRAGGQWQRLLQGIAPNGTRTQVSWLPARTPHWLLIIFLYCVQTKSRESGEGSEAVESTGDAVPLFEKQSNGRAKPTYMYKKDTREDFMSVPISACGCCGTESLRCMCQCWGAVIKGSSRRKGALCFVSERLSLEQYLSGDFEHELMWPERQDGVLVKSQMPFERTIQSSILLPSLRGHWSVGSSVK